MIRKLRWKVIGIIMAMAAVLLIVVFSSMYVAAEQNYRRRSEEAIRTALMAEMPDEVGRQGNVGKNGQGDGALPQPENGPVPEERLLQPENGPVPEERLLQPENDPMPERSSGPEGPMAERALQQSENKAIPDAPVYAEQAILVLEQEADGSIREIRNTTVHQTETEYESLIEAARTHGSDRGELRNKKMRYQYSQNGENGAVCYVFADMYEEMQALSGQVLHSLCIGAAALVLFFMAAFWFSRWAVRPVEEAWRREQQFVADASHELKTPLTVILANAEMVLRDMTKDENMAAGKSVTANLEAKEEMPKEQNKWEDAERAKKRPGG